MKRKAKVNIDICVACGCCVKVCPRAAISVPNGVNAVIDETLCIGCGKCATECPASIITLEEISHES
ncbi:4Fe-4S binding protein [uncultured Ruminococcus sp.]|uniref:4Fe-4S binding protein n=1 Tax=uncultured Ruminococcus sp. TaxID=165186 RepID=UPI0025CE0D63|nr:4Fe-4S binding protein [uncultured Ruminococcus sp.]